MLAVVATLALGAALLVAVVDPWDASATNQSKATNAASVPAADDHATLAGESIPVNAWDVNGVSPARLVDAGWDCLYAVHAVHCLPRGALEGAVAGTTEAATALVFDTQDPAAENAPFLGTEFNIRADLFDGQPCPTDPPSRQYTYLGPGGLDLGLDYYACHRFDSPL